MPLTPRASQKRILMRLRVSLLNISHIGRSGLVILYITAFGFAAKVDKVLVQRSLVKFFFMLFGVCLD